MDGAVNTHTQQMLGFEFDSAQEPFSVLTSVAAIGTVIFQLSQSALDVDSGSQLQIYTASICSFGLILVAVTFFFDFRYNEAQNTVVMNDCRRRILAARMLKRDKVEVENIVLKVS